ncbi:hypothetical protein HDV05_002533 [Chytridiales sp. JEL 0842]|nr:hypothetical protein HDV05_002533 [Chytridiales sp. JEL 0842]
MAYNYGGNPRQRPFDPKASMQSFMSRVSTLSRVEKPATPPKLAPPRPAIPVLALHLPPSLTPGAPIVNNSSATDNVQPQPSRSTSSNTLTSIESSGSTDTVKHSASNPATKPAESAEITSCNISPNLWVWVHGPDDRPIHADISTFIDKKDILKTAATETNLIGYRGESIEIPEHVKVVRGMSETNMMAQGAGSLRGPRGMFTRKPVAHTQATTAPAAESANMRYSTSSSPANVPTVKRVFAQICELHVKSSTRVTQVHCTAQFGNLKAWTFPINLTKVDKKGYGLVAKPWEGFIFEIPGDQPHYLQSQLTIQLHNGPPPPKSTIAASAVISAPDRPPSPTSSIHSISDSTYASSIRSVKSTRSINPLRKAFDNLAIKMKISKDPTPIQQGSLMAEISIPQNVLENLKSEMKSSWEYRMPLVGGAGKEIAVLLLQVGVCRDVDWVPPVKIPEIEFADDLNVQFTRIGGGPGTWKLYWAIIRKGCLEVYKYGEKEDKPIISRIPLAFHLQSVIRPDKELNNTENLLELTFKTPTLFESGEDLNDLQGDTEAAFSWRASALDPYEKKSGKVVVFVKAQSKEGMGRWEEALKVFTA